MATENGCNPKLYKEKKEDQTLRGGRPACGLPLLKDLRAISTCWDW